MAQWAHRCKPDLYHATSPDLVSMFWGLAALLQVRVFLFMLLLCGSLSGGGCIAGVGVTQSVSFHKACCYCEPERKLKAHMSLWLSLLAACQSWA